MAKSREPDERRVAFNRASGRMLRDRLDDSETLPKVSDVTFRVWVHALPKFDVEGRAKVDNVSLAQYLGKTYHARRLTLRRLARSRSELADVGEWIVYGDPGAEIAQDPRFHKHNRTVRGDEADSVLPAPEGWDDDRERRKYGRPVAKRDRSRKAAVGHADGARADAVGNAYAKAERRTRKEKGKREGEAESGEPGTGDPLSPARAERERKRILASAARVFGDDWSPTPKDSREALEAAYLGTCLRWPDYDLDDEIRRSVAGAEAKRLPTSLAWILSHLGEDWTSRKPTSTRGREGDVPVFDAEAYRRQLDDEGGGQG